jgi:imidazole glycerol phosphate synthase subunit HisF
MNVLTYVDLIKFTPATNPDSGYVRFYIKTGGEVAVKDSSGTETVLSVGAISPVLTTPQINDTSSDHQYVFAVSELAADRTVTLPLLTGNDTFVFAAHTQTLTNKTLTSPTITTPTISGAITFPDNIRQTFNPGADAAGINVGSVASSPASPSNGDAWYNSTDDTFVVQIGGGSRVMATTRTAQTFVNKTVVLPLIAQYSDPGSTGLVQLQVSNVTIGATRVLELPNYDATVATIAGTETLTNKTITTPTISGAITFPDNVRQTFNPGADAAGINVGSIAGDPGTPSNGDLWYDSTANELTARINGSNVAP